MNVKKPACVTNPARIPIRDYVCLKVLSYCIPLLDEISEFGDHASSWDKPKYHLRDLASWDMDESRPWPKGDGIIIEISALPRPRNRVPHQNHGKNLKW